MNSKFIQSLVLWVKFNEAMQKKKWHTAEKYLKAIEEVEKSEVVKPEEKVA